MADRGYKNWLVGVGVAILLIAWGMFMLSPREEGAALRSEYTGDGTIDLSSIDSFSRPFSISFAELDLARRSAGDLTVSGYPATDRDFVFGLSVLGDVADLAGTFSFEFRKETGEVITRCEAPLSDWVSVVDGERTFYYYASTEEGETIISRIERGSDPIFFYFAYDPGEEERPLKGELMMRSGGIF